MSVIQIYNFGALVGAALRLLTYDCIAQVQVLLEHNASPLVLDRKGRTPAVCWVGCLRAFHYPHVPQSVRLIY